MRQKKSTLSPLTYKNDLQKKTSYFSSKSFLENRRTTSIYNTANKIYNNLNNKGSSNVLKNKNNLNLLDQEKTIMNSNYAEEKCCTIYLTKINIKNNTSDNFKKNSLFPIIYGYHKKFDMFIYSFEKELNLINNRNLPEKLNSSEIFFDIQNIEDMKLRIDDCFIETIIYMKYSDNFYISKFIPCNLIKNHEKEIQFHKICDECGFINYDSNDINIEIALINKKEVQKIHYNFKDFVYNKNLENIRNLEDSANKKNTMIFCINNIYKILYKCPYCFFDRVNDIQSMYNHIFYNHKNVNINYTKFDKNFNKISNCNSCNLCKNISIKDFNRLKKLKTEENYQNTKIINITEMITIKKLKGFSDKIILKSFIKTKNYKNFRKTFFLDKINSTVLNLQKNNVFLTSGEYFYNKYKQTSNNLIDTNSLNFIIFRPLKYSIDTFSSFEHFLNQRDPYDSNSCKPNFLDVYDFSKLNDISDTTVNKVFCMSKFNDMYRRFHKYGIKKVVKEFIKETHNHTILQNNRNDDKNLGNLYNVGWEYVIEALYQRGVLSDHEIVEIMDEI